MILNATHYFIKKIPNKREIQQIASNHSSYIDFKDVIKLYKDYSKEQYLFLVNDTTLSSDNLLKFRKNKIDNKIEQKRAQYNTLSSGNVSKYRFLTGKDVYPKETC